MKVLSMIVGFVGLLVVLLAIYGRFHDVPTLTLFGERFSGSVVILLGNTLILIAVLLAVLGLYGENRPRS